MECPTSKKVWNILRNDLVEVFQDFVQNALIIKNTNETYICLIPNKAKALKMGEFRPINLISSLYKIISKVLAKRSKKVLLLIIHDAQPPLIKGRQILDAILIASEPVCD